MCDVFDLVGLQSCHFDTVEVGLGSEQAEPKGPSFVVHNPACDVSCCRVRPWIPRGVLLSQTYSEAGGLSGLPGGAEPRSLFSDETRNS